MKLKNNINSLWIYLTVAFEPDEIMSAAEEFEFDTTQMNTDILYKLSDNEIRNLLFDLTYMAVNGLFGGDFHTWNEILRYSLEFDEETIELLNY